MEFSFEKSTATYQIQSYQKGCITIQGKKFDQAVLIMPEHLIVPWGPITVDSLSVQHIEQFLAFKPEVVLIGTGEKLKFLDASLLRPLIEHHIGYEIMNTGAACRTYMLLIAEGRNVAAGLLL